MMLPAAAATVISWILCNLGAYRLAKEGQVAWFRDISPAPKRPLSHAIWDLVYNLWTTWAKSSNDYDKVQWNLFFLLKASLTVYTILLMTAYITSRARKLILFTYYIYGWMSRDGKLTHNSSSLEIKDSKFGGNHPLPTENKNKKEMLIKHIIFPSLGNYERLCRNLSRRTLLRSTSSSSSRRSRNPYYY